MTTSSRKPKTCLITFRNFFQEDRRAQKEVETLLAQGWAVEVIYSGRDFGVPERRPEHPDLTVTSISLKARYAASTTLGAIINLLFFQSRALPRFFAAAWRARADVYHCHNVQALPIGALVAFLRRVPYFYDCRELWREINVAGSGASFSTLWGFLEWVFVPRARATFVVCDMHADYLAEAYKVDRPVVVRNCPPRWDVPESDALRKQYGIPAANTVAIYSGGIFEGVGIDRLIEAADHLDEGVTVVILGFFLRDAFKEHVLAEMAKRPNMIFAKPVSQAEMPAVLSSCDIGVVLYLADYKANQSLPNKLFEYMMCRLAVVTNGYTDTRRVVEGSEAGFALDPVTPQSLADAINRLHRDKQLLAQVRDNARRAAVDVYCWENEVAKMLAAYETLGASPARPAVAASVAPAP
jgi:glycosyltransferase involved in cell wall biosynthesis